MMAPHGEYEGERDGEMVRERVGKMPVEDNASGGKAHEKKKPSLMLSSPRPLLASPSPPGTSCASVVVGSIHNLEEVLERVIAGAGAASGDEAGGGKAFSSSASPRSAFWPPTRRPRPPPPSPRCRPSRGRTGQRRSPPGAGRPGRRGRPSRRRGARGPRPRGRRRGRRRRRRREQGPPLRALWLLCPALYDGTTGGVLAAVDPAASKQLWFAPLEGSGGGGYRFTIDPRRARESSAATGGSGEGSRRLAAAAAFLVARAPPPRTAREKARSPRAASAARVAGLAAALRGAGGSFLAARRRAFFVASRRAALGGISASTAWRPVPAGHFVADRASSSRSPSLPRLRQYALSREQLASAGRSDEGERLATTIPFSLSFWPSPIVWIHSPERA